MNTPRLQAAFSSADEIRWDSVKQRIPSSLANDALNASGRRWLSRLWLSRAAATLAGLRARCLTGKGSAEVCIFALSPPLAARAGGT